MATLTPTVLWAPREDLVYVKIEISNATEESIQLEEESLKFSATSEGKKFTLDLPLYGKIVPDKSKWKKWPRYIELCLSRAETGAYWPRLHKDGKPHYIKIDWNKWKDEDEDEEKKLDSGMDNFDMSSLMGGGGGFPGMGGGAGFPGMGGLGMDDMDFDEDEKDDEENDGDQEKKKDDDMPGLE